MISFHDFLQRATEGIEEAAKLPPVKATGFWTDQFGEGGIMKASIEDLYKHAKKHPKGLIGGLKSLQLLASYGSFPDAKMESLWDRYNKDKEEK